MANAVNVSGSVHPLPDPDRLAFFILKNLGKAVREHAMVRSGDRIAVAVSGGKDSLSLLRLLQIYRRTAGIDFESGCDPRAGGRDRRHRAAPAAGRLAGRPGCAVPGGDAGYGRRRPAAAELPALHLAAAQGLVPGRGCAGLQRRRVRPPRGRRRTNDPAQPALRRRCALPGAGGGLLRRPLPADPPAALRAGKRAGAFRPRQRLPAPAAGLPARAIRGARSSPRC